VTDLDGSLEAADLHYDTDANLSVDMVRVEYAIVVSLYRDVSRLKQ